MTYRNNCVFIMATTALAVVMAMPAHAQQGSDNQGPAAGEIVVTAKKREQSLSDVGLTVAAMSGAALDAQRIGNVADLASVTPGLNFAPSPNATPVYTLRGVGFFESSLAAYPSVSLYIDQAPLPFPVYSTLTAFDLERVEVLKGPQGTLFGNNATSGAINFVAAKPTDHLAAGGELTYGRFNLMEAQGFLSGPITSNLKARIAFKTTQADGWQRSYTRDDTNGKTDQFAIRGLLAWEPTDNLTVQLNLNMWRDHSQTQAPAAILHTPQNDTSGPPVGPGAANWTPGSVWPVTVYPLAPNDVRAADWTPGLPKSNNRFRQAALQVDYDIGHATITSLTNFADMKFNNATEAGGTALADNDIAADVGSMRTFTQELRVSNGAKGRIRWVVGGNYENSHVYELNSLRYDQTTSTYVNGIVISTYWTDQRMRNLAAFANLEADVTDSVTLKGGYRYTNAKRDYLAFNGDVAGYPIGQDDNFALSSQPGNTLVTFFNNVYPAIYGAGRVPTIAPYSSIIIDNRSGPDGTLDYSPSTFLKTGMPTGHLNEGSHSWMVGVDFKPARGTLLYANVSRGYKAGSFGQIAGAIYDGYVGVKQESILAYEAGFKLLLAHRTLSINGALFYYDYNNKQLRGKFVDPIFGALDQLVNVPKSSVKGAEIEVNARPMNGLTLTASGNYTDAKVKEYVGVVGLFKDSNGLAQPIKESFAGRTLPFSPKLQYSFRADYETPLSGDVDLFFGVGVHGQSKSRGVLTTLGVQPENIFDLQARALVDGNIGVHAADNSWKLTFWGKNIFNKFYNTNVVQSYDTVVRYTGRPAEYGVTLGFRM